MTIPTHHIDEAVYLGSRVAVLTRRPGRLKALFEVDLPRPRIVEALASGEFIELSELQDFGDRTSANELRLYPSPDVFAESSRSTTNTTTMSKILNEVLAANRNYAETFGDKATLALPPARRFAILTCMDARLDPANTPA